MQAFLFLTALAAASAVDCRKRTIPDFLCLLTAAAGLISFSPAQFFGVLAALPLLIAALIRPECMGGGDIKLTAAAGFVLGFWRGIWGMALGLLLAVLYFLARRILRRHGDGAKLLGPVAFRWALAGWAASLLIEIPRWLVVTPRLAAYVENGIFSDPAISAAYTNAARWFAVLRWGVIAATVVLAALAERKKAAEDAAEEGRG